MTKKTVFLLYLKQGDVRVKAGFSSLENALTYAYAWEYINGSWWAFDENGYAKTGWLRDEAFGGWFYMDPERGMQTGWVLIDGVWYYFHPVSDGRRGIMYAGQKTPDGYYVDENGAWDDKEK